MELKSIKRMLLGIGFILFSFTVDSSEFFSYGGISLLLTGFFSKEYENSKSYLKTTHPNDFGSDE
jgi:hypothetical protein